MGARGGRGFRGGGAAMCILVLCSMIYLQTLTPTACLLTEQSPTLGEGEKVTTGGGGRVREETVWGGDGEQKSAGMFEDFPPQMSEPSPLHEVLIQELKLPFSGELWSLDFIKDVQAHLEVVELPVCSPHVTLQLLASSPSPHPDLPPVSLQHSVVSHGFQKLLRLSLTHEDQFPVVEVLLALLLPLALMVCWRRACVIASAGGREAAVPGVEDSGQPALETAEQGGSHPYQDSHLHQIEEWRQRLRTKETHTGCQVARPASQNWTGHQSTPPTEQTGDNYDNQSAWTPGGEPEVQATSPVTSLHPWLLQFSFPTETPRPGVSCAPSAPPPPCPMGVPSRMAGALLTVALLLPLVAVCAMTSNPPQLTLRMGLPQPAKLRRVRMYSVEPDLQEVYKNSSLALVSRLQLLDYSDCTGDMMQCPVYAACDGGVAGQATCRCSRGFYLTQGQCQPCAKSVPEGQFLLTPCTRVRNAVFKACKVCSNTQYVAAPCTATQDTICVDVSFPVGILPWNQSLLEDVGAHVAVQISANVFLERLAAMTELEAPMYNSNNQQSMELVWERESGLQIKLQVTGDYLVPEYQEVPHADDTNFYMYDKDVPESMKILFSQIKDNYCSHPLPDYYSLHLDIEERTSAAQEVTCDSTNASVPRCPPVLRDGDKFIKRDINRNCSQLADDEKTYIRVPLYDLSNSVVCAHTSSLLTSVFRLPPLLLTSMDFPSPTCREQRLSCEQCLQKPPCSSTDESEACCSNLACYRKSECTTSYSPQCPPSPIQCVSGDVNLFTLSPIFETLGSRLMCHLAYRKPPYLYNVSYEVILPRLGLTLPFRNYSVGAGDREAHRQQLLEVDFMRVQHDTFYDIHPEVVATTHHANLTSPLSAFQVHALKQAPEDFGHARDFTVHRNFDTRYATFVQFESPFYYSSSSFHRDGCHKNLSKVYPNQTLYRAEGVRLQTKVFKRKGSGSGDRLTYQMYRKDQPPYIRLTVPAGQSILSTFQRVNSTTLLASSLHASLLWEHALRKWKVVISGQLSDCPGILSLQLLDKLLTRCLAHYDVFVACPPHFQLNLTFYQPQDGLPDIFVALINDSITSHKLVLSSIVSPQSLPSPKSDSVLTRSDRPSVSSPWTPVLAIACLTLLGLVTLLSLHVCVRLQVSKQQAAAEKARSQEAEMASASANVNPNIINPNINPNVHPHVHPNINPNIGPNINPINPNINPNINPHINPNINPNLGPNINPINPNLNPNMSPNINPMINPNNNANVNPNNPNNNPNNAPGVNAAASPESEKLGDEGGEARGRQPASPVLVYVCVVLYVVYCLLCSFSLGLGLLYFAQLPLVANLNSSVSLADRLHSQMNASLELLRQQETARQTAMLANFQERQTACQAHLEQETERLAQQYRALSAQQMSAIYLDNGSLAHFSHAVLNGSARRHLEQTQDFIAACNQSAHQHLASFSAHFHAYLQQVTSSPWLEFPLKIFEHRDPDEESEAELTERQLQRFLVWLQVDKALELLDLHRSLDVRMAEILPSTSSYAPPFPHLTSLDQQRVAMTTKTRTQRYRYSVLPGDTPTSATPLSGDHAYYAGTNASVGSDVTGGVSRGGAMDLALYIMVACFLVLDLCLWSFRLVWLYRQVMAARQGYEDKIPTDAVTSEVLRIQTGHHTAHAPEQGWEASYAPVRQQEERWTSDSELFVYFCQAYPKSKEDILREIWAHKMAARPKTGAEAGSQSPCLPGARLFCHWFHRVFLSGLLWRLCLLALLFLLLCLLLQLFDSWILQGPLRWMFGEELLTSELQWHTDMANQLLTSSAQQLNAQLWHLKTLVDGDVLLLNTKFTDTVQRQTDLLLTLMAALCGDASGAGCNVSALLLPLPAPVASCNFLPLQAQLLPDPDAQLLRSFVEDELLPLVEQWRHLVFRGGYVLLLYVAAIMLCQTLARVVRHYLLVTGQLPRVQVFQVSDTGVVLADPPHDTHKQIQRTGSWLESCESGVYVGDNEDSTRESVI